MARGVDAVHGRLIEQTSRLPRLARPVREFIATQNSSAVLLLAATVAALVWANSPWSSSYEDLWGTTLAVRVGDGELSLDLRHWVNDGLMAFFFVAGLELRREFDMGELRERRRVATPVLAALGGMVAPALIYLAFNAGESTVRGWAIPMGTDTAFALGVLALVGGRWAPRIRTFRLTLVIVDDVVALTVVALAYTEDLSIAPLLVAVALFGVVLIMRRAGIRRGVAYFLVAFALWVVTSFTGTFTGPLELPDGTAIELTGESFDVMFSTIARWRDGKIVEEYLKYDNASFMQQIGLA
jgi:Na+/H+ antiporter NhaA